MPSITVKIDGHDEPFELDMSLDALSLRESVWLQRQVGNRRFDAMVEKGEIELRPDFLQAFIYCKLKSQVRDIDADSFDVDFGEIQEYLTEADEGKA